MISASVLLFAPDQLIEVDARNGEVAAWSSLPAAKVNLKTAELFEFLSTALKAM